MGLCKCPKRKVTQHFCFEHRVNVCEFCMVHDHVKCIVQPYLQWLEDSSYSSNCRFCSQPLADEICIRLLCYHIFHWRCFNRYAQDHPPNTTPAGYTCPDCNMTIFPPASSNSPISIQLKNLLANAEWAKPGLALSGTNGPASGTDPRSVSFTDLIQEDDEANHIQVLKHHDRNNHSVPININPVSSFMDSTQWATSRSSSTIHESRLPLLMDNDVDEDKYKSKPPSEFITRWLRSRQSFLPGTSASDTSSIMALYGKYIIPIIIVIAIIFTLIHYFLKYGREAANRDLSLDPAFNPNIRIEGD